MSFSKEMKENQTRDLQEKVNRMDFVIQHESGGDTAREGEPRKVIMKVRAANYMEHQNGHRWRR